VDTTKLYKRNGKAEKAKTEENKAKTEEEKKTVEETSKALEEKTAEVETLKKEVAKKEDQLNKKAINEFNDEALLSMANCVETLIKKHCPMVPKDFDFASFETDLFAVYESHWDLKVLDK
jgi:molecular chaperone GrpE (heat shock protein)